MQLVRADRPRDEVRLSQDEVTSAINDYVFKHTGRRVAGTVQITQVAGNGFNTTAKLMHDGEDEVTVIPESKPTYGLIEGTLDTTLEVVKK
jgi:hypothetical protein